MNGWMDGCSRRFAFQNGKEDTNLREEERYGGEPTLPEAGRKQGAESLIYPPGHPPSHSLTDWLQDRKEFSKPTRPGRKTPQRKRVGEKRKKKARKEAGRKYCEDGRAELKAPPAIIVCLSIDSSSQ
mmetsp:Transcript_39663/g.78119  ORF Transcript_39663/g.78119 Transcript_39663/m.78119 type:complete len:127 (+) Transcript_39663:1642-2022(+)